MKPMGKVLLFGNVKGGVGKTTLATNTSVYLKNKGFKVLLMDADESQHSSSLWADRRDFLDSDKYSPIACIEKTGRINKALVEMKGLYDYVVVDTGRSDSVELRSGLLVADKFIVPTAPGQFDLEVLYKVQETIEGAQINNESLESIFVINKAPTNNKIKFLEENARMFIEEDDVFSDIKIAKNTLHERVSYSHATIEGKSVLEMSDQKAKIEVKKLIKEVIGE